MSVFMSQGVLIQKRSRFKSLCQFHHRASQTQVDVGWWVSPPRLIFMTQAWNNHLKLYAIRRSFIAHPMGKGMHVPSQTFPNGWAVGPLRGSVGYSPQSWPLPPFCPGSLLNKGVQFTVAMCTNITLPHPSIFASPQFSNTRGATVAGRDVESRVSHKAWNSSDLIKHFNFNCDKNEKPYETDLIFLLSNN